MTAKNEFVYRTERMLQWTKRMNQTQAKKKKRIYKTLLRKPSFLIKKKIIVNED